MKSVVAFLIVLMMAALSSAFVPPSPLHSSTLTSSRLVQGGKPLHMIFPKKDEEEDLSYIESRDMTRDEMFKYNAATEDVMNQELIGMTIFSLVICVPLFYLVWVALNAETVENIDTGSF